MTKTPRKSPARAADKDTVKDVGKDAGKEAGKDAVQTPASTETIQEKPSGSDAKPGAHVDDRAGLPTDGGAGDPHATAPAMPPESDRSEGAGNPAGPAMGELQGNGSERLPDVAPTVVIVKAKRDGYRRGGIAHTREEVTHEIGLFTPEQLEQLVADPGLTVRLA